MRYDGKNLIEVLEAHMRWIESGGENDEDRADFSGANLRGVCLAYANLFGADFREADMYAACLFRANLERADLTGADLLEADLYGTKLRGAIGVPFISQHVPDTGSFIAWKRINIKDEERTAIAKLLIPEDAQRLSLYNGEYRASKANVLEIQELDGTVLPDAVGVSIKDGETLYIPGKTVSVRNFSTDMYRNHMPGIYFYLERKAACCYMSRGYDADGNPMPLDIEKMKKEFDEAGGFACPVEVMVPVVKGVTGDDESGLETETDQP